MESDLSPLRLLIENSAWGPDDFSLAGLAPLVIISMIIDNKRGAIIDVSERWAWRRTSFAFLSLFSFFFPMSAARTARADGIVLFVLDASRAACGGR